jgi:hypothetical protein
VFKYILTIIVDSNPDRKIKKLIPVSHHLQAGSIAAIITDAVPTLFVTLR